MPQPSPVNNLLAVLLVTQSRPGPRLVFHCPASPGGPRASTSDLESDEETSDCDEETDIPSNLAAGLPGPQVTRSHIGTFRARDAEPPKAGVDSNYGDLWGLAPGSLARLLSPGRWSDGKKFEVGIDGVTFVGQPVFAKLDGTWGKSHARSAWPESTKDSEEGTSGRGESRRGSSPSMTRRDAVASGHVVGSLESNELSAVSLGTSMASTSSNDIATEDELDMFHVVFALGNTTATANHAASLAAEQVYEHIAKPLSRALKYLQREGAYVSRQSKAISAASQTASSANNPEHICQQSDLATALRSLWLSLQRSEIATLSLRSTSISLLIPDASANAALDEATVLGSSLLLLEDKPVFLASLSSDPSSPLILFIRASKSTKALSKTAATLSLAPEKVLELVEHLLHYRKTRLINPLHVKNVYATSPDLPLERLGELNAEWERQFPALPPLMRLLGAVSARASRWEDTIDEAEGREMWMQGLAWLLREGMVVMVKTVGWMKMALEDEKVAEETKKEGWRLMTDPLHMSEEQQQILDLRVEEVRKTDPELADRLPEIVRFSDGEHALEGLAPRLKIKRAKFESWLITLRDRGWLHTAQVV